MSVVGIDFGTQSCYIAVARTGGIETIDNEYSDRCTPNYVSFGDKVRSLGHSAKNQCITNFRNTIFSYKDLLGKLHSNDSVKCLKRRVPYTVVAGENDQPLVEVKYRQETYPFTPVQIAAMMLGKLKETAEAALKTKVTDCVVSVPSLYTDVQRRAMLDACQMANLNCLRLMNDTTAAALAYGIYKQDLPEENENSRVVIFVDMGYAHLQISACAFNKGKLKMLGVSTTEIGGRDFDEVILNYFVEDFKHRYKIDARSNKKAMIRLIQECEKLKKQLSVNTQPSPFNLECFMDDKDVSGKLDRAKFEEMCEPFLKKAEETMKDILVSCNLQSSDLHSVEIIGGASRIHSIKQLVKTIYETEPKTTMNADEVVARGSALQCAILSPTFRVRDFSIIDCQPYSITASWDADDDENSKLEVFPKFHVVPFAKMLTFYRKEPFQLRASYSPSEEVLEAHRHIGSFNIDKVVPQASGEKSKLKIKLRVNIHGILSVVSATMVEKVEGGEETEEMDVENAEEIVNNEKNTNETNPAEKNEEEDVQMNCSTEKEAPKENGDVKQDSPNEEKKVETQTNVKKSKKVKMVDLPIEPVVPQLSKEEVNFYIERESQMKFQDKLENDRADAKNAVEEYVYEIREKIYGPLEKFIKEEDRSVLSKMLDDTENWLYEEGEDEKKEVYIDKLSELKKMGQPVINRYREAEERPQAFIELGSTLQSVHKALELYANKDEKYDHLLQSDIEIVEKDWKEKLDWFELHQNLQNQMSPDVDPVVTVIQIRTQRQSLENTCYPILNKPKPKVETPAPAAEPSTTNPDPTPDSAAASTATEDNMENQEVKPETTQSADSSKTEEKMDVD